MDLNNTDSSKWLVLGMLRSTEVMDLAFQKLTIGDFLPSESSMKVAFLIGQKWYKANRTTAPYEVVVSSFEQDILRHNLVSYAEAAQFGEDLDWVYRFSSDMQSVRNHILDILAEFLINRKVRTAAQGLDTSRNILDNLVELNKTVARSAISKVVFIDPFEADMPIMCNDIRIPLGVDFMDMVTSGGATPGETILIMAPSGGGKTLLNVQIATTAALNGEDAMIITYEQGASPGITNRVYACALGLPINHFNGINPGLFHGNNVMKDKYDKVRRKIRGKLKVVDQLKAAQNNQGGSGGASEIATIIKHAQDSGSNPRYVGIDWLGPMVNNYMAVKGINSGELTKTMSSFADDLRKVGDALKVNICIFHQLGTEASASGPRRKPQATDAHNCRTLHHYMDTVVCIGNRDMESHLAWVNAPKVRNGMPFNDMLIQMEGAMSRWKMVDRSEVNSESMKFYGQASEEGAEGATETKLTKVKNSRLEYNDAVRANLG